ncbi:Crotonobetainyl-CoA:carnitine CoA-transferase CaiB [Modicisalibacter muralis]|uniref:Crotonobetainyl-CoA:carnitine CoA-transferase CaiB n=1 Tax=Modicisalibacter muralis TaxID=119000 RepID=A0A1G9FM36_9GAMM|nr:CaiB/BaiF CoA-transferase family protein [Halomonas muralis]SDK89402.1 Crotonobetainyl-CoA:carnitine CoA-transferase CaiB [Halomonas muralis]
MASPLQGVVVLDMSRVLAGPWSGQLLADLGAQVIKIERPQGGDDTRGWGPPWLEDSLEQGGPREAAYYLCANRGKASVTVDISHPQGQALIRELAAQADILIENFKVGGLARYGLDYASLTASNPRLIGCSITGFGQDGPYAHRAGYDFMIQAMGGLMSLTGEPDGQPMKTGVAITDVMTGLYATVGILAALNERQRTGRGRQIDVSLLDVQVATLANQSLNALVSGASPSRHGNAHPNIVPYEAFPCADGHLVLTVGNDSQFARLAKRLGQPEWASDPAYATNAARVAHRQQLVPMIATLLRRRTRDEWLADFEADGIPAGPINTVSEVFDDPQVRHRGMAFDFIREGARIPQVANPLRFDSQPQVSDRPPPRLGEDTARVLGERLGLDDERLAALRAQGVI